MKRPLARCKESVQTQICQNAKLVQQGNSCSGAEPATATSLLSRKGRTYCTAGLSSCPATVTPCPRPMHCRLSSMQWMGETNCCCLLEQKLSLCTAGSRGGPTRLATGAFTQRYDVPNHSELSCTSQPPALLAGGCKPKTGGSVLLLCVLPRWRWLLSLNRPENCRNLQSNCPFRDSRSPLLSIQCAFLAHRPIVENVQFSAAKSQPQF